MLIHRVLALLIVGTLTTGSRAVVGAAEKADPVDVATLISQAEGGDAQAQCRLGTYYAEGPKEGRDFAKARLWLEAAAKQGNGEAQRRLGRLYGFGDPSIHDSKQAARWYALAADQGDAIAQNNLVSCTRN